MPFLKNKAQSNSWLCKRWVSKVRLLPWFLPIVIPSVWFGYRQVESSFTQPQAVVVLGGSETRERFAAKFALQNPELPVWISSGSPKWYVERIFAKAGIEGDRLHLDYQAVDTVTNFTTLVDELKDKGINSVYLVTSDNHMRRARLIGDIVFGSRGIALKPISVDSGKKNEPLQKCLRDTARALFWLTTGYTGAKLPSAKQ